MQSDIRTARQFFISALMFLASLFLFGCGERTVNPDTRAHSSDLTSNSPLRTNYQIFPTINHGSAVKMVQAYDGSRAIVSIGTDGSIRFWDAGTRTSLWNAEASQEIMSFEKPKSPVVGFKNRSSGFMTWHADNELRVWDIESPHEPAAKLKTSLPHDAAIQDATWFNSTSMFISWDVNNRLYLWTDQDGKYTAKTYDIGVPITDISGYKSILYISTSTKTAYTLNLEDDEGLQALNLSAPLSDIFVKSAGVMKDSIRTTFAVTRDGKVMSWDPENHKAREELFQFSSKFSDFQVRNDRTYVVGIDADNNEQAFHLMTGEIAGKTDEYGASVFGLTRPDTPLSITLHNNGIAKLWFANTDVQMGGNIVHGPQISGAKFINYGRHLVTWSEDGLIKFHKVTAAYNSKMNHQGYVLDARFSYNEQMIATSGSDGRLKIWDAKTGGILASMKHGGRDVRNEIFEAVFSPNDEVIATRNRDGSLKLWNTQTYKQIGRTAKTEDTIGKVVFSKDSQTLIYMSYAGTIGKLDTKTGKQIGPILKHDVRIHDVVLSKDETMILTGGEGEATLWAAQTGERIATLPHNDLVSYVTFFDEDQAILTTDYGGTAKIWRINDGVKLNRSFVQGERILSAHFSKDERRLLTSGFNGIHLWNVESGDRLLPPMLHDDSTVFGAIFSPDETKILSWNEGLKLWDATTGEEIADLWVLRGQHERHTCTEFSKDGQFILTSTSKDGDVRLYDVETGKQVGVALPHVGYVRCAKFSANDNKVISYANSAASLWDVSWKNRLIPEE